MSRNVFYTSIVIYFDCEFLNYLPESFLPPLKKNENRTCVVLRFISERWLWYLGNLNKKKITVEIGRQRVSCSRFEGNIY